MVVNQLPARRIMRLWFLLLVVVVLAAVFACYEFYPRPADSATDLEVSGRLDASQASTHLENGGGTESHTKRRLSQTVIDGVEKLVLFVGYRRSGHSIIGSMMDAHPNMVIAYQYKLLPRCMNSRKHGRFPKTKSDIFNALYENSHRQAKKGWTSENFRKNMLKGYNLHVSTPWQGVFTDLRVIGDKAGSVEATKFFDSYQKAKACLLAIMDIVKVPLIIFHVVRNPFDMIATEVLHTTTNQSNMQAKDLTVAKPDDRDVKKYANIFFTQATAVTRVIELARVVEIHSEDFVADPRKTVRDICSTLGLPCPEEYVEACYEKAYKKSSKSRYNMEWSPDMLQYVGNTMKNYSFFSRYTFDS